MDDDVLFATLGLPLPFNTRTFTSLGVCPPLDFFSVVLVVLPVSLMVMVVVEPDFFEELWLLVPPPPPLPALYRSKSPTTTATTRTMIPLALASRPLLRCSGAVI